MEMFILLVFILGYVTITMEHKLKIDKLVPALIMMVLTWTALAIGIDSVTSWFDPNAAKLNDISTLVHEERISLLENTLLHHFGKTAEILVFLIGAMAIVELIDYFEGFASIKKLIKTKSKRKLLWIISLLGFSLSAVIDNLTTTIILITILRKIVPNQSDRLWYSGFIIIAANAGGAWTPIGDVTTTMLWMSGKVTSAKLILLLGIPSLLNILVPLLIGSFMKPFKGEIEVIDERPSDNRYATLMLYLGLSLFIFVPVFKTLTHLPPYLGMMLSLSIFIIVAEILTRRKFSLSRIGSENGSEAKSPTMHSLSKIEMPSVLFFLGILMTVAAMESVGMIFHFGEMLNARIPEELFVTLLGISSAVIDNVPLVAASTGMFQHAPDANLWHFIAYAAGTGGSILIIGSAAGVVAMGMEKIGFVWYLKNISLLALLGYLSGIGFLFFFV